MDFSLTRRKVNMGKLKDKEVFVAHPVCQKHHITFDELCKRMADDSTVGQADVAAVFYRFRMVLNELCSHGFIVDGGPIGTFRPTFTSKAVLKEEDPTADFRRLKDVEFFRVAAQEKPKSKKKKKEEKNEHEENGPVVG